MSHDLCTNQNIKSDKLLSEADQNIKIATEELMKALDSFSIFRKGKK